MNRQTTLVLACVLALALGASSACSRTSDTKAQVDKALSDANLNNVHTTYDKDGNVVHLQGTVDNAETRQRAEQVATDAVGTSGKVLDELKIQGMDEKPADDRDKLIEDTLKDQVSQDQVLRDRNITFDVSSGAVTIKGDVRTQGERQKVGQIVTAVSGVSQVANELEVKPKK
jgi:hyperosmotically inducible periplasmic protein